MVAVVKLVLKNGGGDGRRRNHNGFLDFFVNNKVMMLMVKWIFPFKYTITPRERLHSKLEALLQIVQEVKLGAIDDMSLLNKETSVDVKETRSKNLPNVEQPLPRLGFELNFCMLEFFSSYWYTAAGVTRN
ncbi:hypothetical protein FXO38_07002 [Capsicum annuum]|nr:hypothetical protein FXO38_07002 [Capsicum annuum]KAF3672882.1 hypothetical protein FXO37_07282 [Capsicum annuum]